MSARHYRYGALAAGALVLLAGYAQHDTARAAPPHSAFNTTLSIHDVMVSVVDPAADALWDSVGTVVTASGTEEHRPRTDDDWNLLRQHAVRLAESANLLIIPGRPVVVQGRKLDDANVPGVLNAAEVGKAIQTKRKGFETAAQHLHAAAVEALAAIDRRDVTALSNAGGTIDRACESCHLVYWYPNARRPPVEPVSASTQAASLARKP